MTSSVIGQPQLLVLAGRFFDVARREMKTLEVRFPGLRGSHFRLLALIPEDGARISDLADEALMTKQALGQFVRYMQGLGYTEISADPGDRRAKIVRKSARGREAEDAAMDVIDQLETRWRDQIGERRYRDLRRALRELGSAGRP